MMLLQNEVILVINVYLNILLFFRGVNNKQGIISFTRL